MSNYIWCLWELGIQVPLRSWTHPGGYLGIVDPKKLAVFLEKPFTRGLTVRLLFKAWLELIAEEQVTLMEAEKQRELPGRIPKPPL